MSDDKAPKMKSAYELALERMSGQGIEPPRDEALSPEVRQRVAEARQKTEAKLAELEILHQDALRKSQDFAASGGGSRKTATGRSRSCAAVRSPAPTPGRPSAARAARTRARSPRGFPPA